MLQQVVLIKNLKGKILKRLLCSSYFNLYFKYQWILSFKLFNMKGNFKLPHYFISCLKE